MFIPPIVFVLITTATLGLWFFRSGKRDASLWMYATYAGVFGLAFSHYTSVSTLDVALPKVIRDFLLIGVAGLFQSMAVAKRISIWQAIGGIGLMYFLVYLLPFEGEESIASINNEPSYTNSTSSIQNTSTISLSLDPTGEYLLELLPSTTPTMLANWANQHNSRVYPAFEMADESETLLDNYYVLDVQENSTLTLAEIEQAGLTNWVEENELVALNLPENIDLPFRTETPMVNDSEASKQWAMEVLNMREYFQLLNELKPKKTARIAILDTGVDAQHEDLKGNFFSLQKKYDDDPRGHGTHCAGIAAAVTNNGIGIASMAGANNLVELTSIKVLGAGGSGSQRTIIQGILEAADAGVDVISMSLGGFSNNSRQRAYNQAISYAKRNNVIVVVAAGNSNREATGFAPANAAGAICVAASDQLNLRAPFSNRVGGIKMALAAPGVNIHSTYPDDRYKMFSGTSMACPLVAGLIAVMRSQNPELTTQDVYDILHKTGLSTNEEAQLGRIVQPTAALALLKQ